MSTWYISALLSPDRTSSVLGIGLRGTEGGEQMGQLLIVGAVEVDGEVWPLPSGEQPEPVLGQPGDGGQVDGAEAGEPAAEQIAERHVEDCEDGAADRPGTRRGLCAVRGFAVCPGVSRPPRITSVAVLGGRSARNRDRCSIRSPGIRQGYRRSLTCSISMLSHAVSGASGRRESDPHDQLGRLRAPGR
jgi:hypothetical protein